MPKNDIRGFLKKRILVLDGATGTMLQAQGLTPADFNRGPFANHPVPLKGDNDVLCLTRPDAVKRVHTWYLEAGADIISTNTFSSNAVTQADYQLQNRVYDLAYAGAKIAREAADEFSTPEKPRFVAGDVGPTGRTASMSPSVDDPAARNITFDELVETYLVQMNALLDGGADLFLIETVFDTLNCKAALYAADEVMTKRGIEVPVMVSATLSDASGRMLSGQSVEALINSVSHAKGLLSIGLNCSLGADEMRPHIAEIAAKTHFFTSAHPNAGLPDAFGKYTQTPEHMASVMRSFALDGLVNIAGGCCGTTPEHIRLIAKALEGLPPRVPPEIRPCLRLAGLDAFNSEYSNFINVGERTNVAGSRKFLRLVRENNMKEAMAVAAKQIADGASVIDVNMDDPMLDAKECMKRFLLYLASEPEIARVPVMIDSSDWNVVRAALRCVQGRPIVNSISLKEGEEKFLEKAREIRRLGAAVLVMAFDEAGQADTLERRIAVCSRSYGLLTQKAGFPPQDIVFDPNVFAIATGMPEHDNHAVDFIEAVRALKKKYPLCGFSGGISNVSFSFRGNDAVRGAIHTVFLKHAVDAGLTMGIVNASQLGVYDSLDPELRKAAEDVVLNRYPGAAEKLLALASKMTPAAREPGVSAGTVPEWRKGTLEERIVNSLVRGDDSFAEADMTEALAEYPDPVRIVEGPLMQGMSKVGELFGAGKLFLPQVVKSARVMKRSVAVLMPVLEKLRNKGEKPCTVVLATVKGDVHDIGKNIVSVVLQCNSCRIIDLGVMVPAEKIVDSAIREHADIVGLSGLITPSLEEMANVVREMRRRKLDIPVILGGAATSELHTALKIAPLGNFPVVCVRDASSAVPVVANLSNPEKRKPFAETLAKRYSELAKADGSRRPKTLLSPEEARKRARVSMRRNPVPRKTGTESFALSAAALAPLLDWERFLKTWETPPCACVTADLVNDAKTVLAKTSMTAECACGVFPAHSRGDSIVLEDGTELPTARRREDCPECPAVCDWLTAEDSGIPDWLGMFVVSVRGADSEAAAYSKRSDEYSALLVKTLALSLAEAAAEAVHRRINREFFGIAEKSGIRPAPGYPDLPDHQLKVPIFRLLDAEKKMSVRLTSSAMMVPEASVCALCIANPEARYISVS